jgi:hypothetical protein
MRGRKVERRLVWRDDRPGYDVVVDGRRLTLEEFGSALEPLEGWTFRLSAQGIEAAELPDHLAESVVGRRRAAQIVRPCMRSSELPRWGDDENAPRWE